MARLTRSETQAQTRAALVATAERLFLAEGYNATSLLQVAQAAGFTKGAVYSNFATKHELGLAVLESLQDQRVGALIEALVAADGLGARVEAFGRWAEENIGDVGWTAFEVEFATSARHSEEIRDALAQRRRMVTQALADLLADQAAEHGVELPAPALDVATRLLALGVGLGVQRAFDPELPVRLLVEEVRRLLPS